MGRIQTPASLEAGIPRDHLLEGRHALAEVACDARTRTAADVGALVAAMAAAAEACGFHVVGEPAVHGFEPRVTVVVMLAESHVAVHTFPEHGRIKLEVFTCGPGDAAGVAHGVAERLGADILRLEVVDRGAARSVKPRTVGRSWHGTLPPAGRSPHPPPSQE